MIGGLNQPVTYGPADLNLNPNGLINQANGFQGGPFPQPSGDNSVDFMWAWDRELQKVRTGRLIWYSQGGPWPSGWRFASPGFPAVPVWYFKGCDAILIQRGERPQQQWFYEQPVHALQSADQADESVVMPLGPNG